MIKIKYLHTVTLIILTFIPIRGFFIYHFDFIPNQVYTFSAFILVSLSIFCVGMIFKKKENDNLLQIRKVFFWNYIFTGFYFIVTILLVGFNQISLLYQFILFPVVFFLLSCKTKKLYLGIHIISLVILSGTYLFYNLGVNYGFDAISDANLRLRPGELSYSRIGENYLPGGYLGDHHDNANILVMSSAFYFSQSMNKINKNRIIYFILFFLFTSFLIFTGSASNIISFLIVIGIILIIYNRKILLIILISLLLFFSQFEKYLYFTEKIKQNQSDLESGGMFNSLNFSSLFNSLHSILLGAGDFFQPPMMKSEIAFIKILLSIGILPFLCLLFILFSPIYYIYKFNKYANFNLNLLRDLNFIQFKKVYKIKKVYLRYLIIQSVPVITGTLTLLHYGSLFRITSICMYCILMTIFFKSYLYINKKFDIILNLNT
jgi:hypothetical protein